MDVDVRLSSFEEYFGDSGLASVREVEDWLESKTHHVELPEGLMMIALARLNSESTERKFGIINTHKEQA